MVSGGVAGTIAEIVSLPMDTLKIRAMVATHRGQEWFGYVITRALMKFWILRINRFCFGIVHNNLC